MKIAELNKEVRETFAQVMVLPEWDNVFCYWTRCPEYPSRLHTTTELLDRFSISKRSAATIDKIIVQSLDKTCLLTDRRCYRNSIRGSIELNDLKLPQKTQKLSPLRRAELIKIIDGKVVFNPAFVYGRDWYSPFVQGVLLVEWMNEQLIDIRVNDIPSELEQQLTIKGVEYGTNWLKNSL